MTQEEYNQLDIDYAHCAGTHCEKARQCLRHTAYTMLEMSTKERYMVLNPYVVTGAQPCPFFELDRKERFAWGISSIYDNVRAADLRRARYEGNGVLRLGSLLQGKAAMTRHHRGRAGNGSPLVYRNGQRRQCHRVRPL